MLMAKHGIVVQEMPPHVTLPLYDPVLGHFNYEGEDPSRTASKANYLQLIRIQGIQSKLSLAIGRDGRLQKILSIVI